MECELCGKKIDNDSKITMVNKINGNKLEICKECYDTFWKDNKEVSYARQNNMLSR